MNLAAFRKTILPCQSYSEWLVMFEFLENYFHNRGITNPVVIEIGVERGFQKRFYEGFLNARHIGIDISDKYSKPDILGDSHAPETMAKLLAMLGGKKANMVFIDARHTYADALQDYETFGPLASDIIAFHDIYAIGELARCWEDLQAREKKNPYIAFMSLGAWRTEKYQMGIGLIVKHMDYVN